MAIAKAAGFVISAEELKRAQAAKRAQAEVSEEELEGVAGGCILGSCWSHDTKGCFLDTGAGCF